MRDGQTREIRGCKVWRVPCYEVMPGKTAVMYRRKVRAWGRDAKGRPWVHIWIGTGFVWAEVTEQTAEKLTFYGVRVLSEVPATLA